MTLRHLRIFVEVYQAGSMTRAAERLFVSQPSVSLAVGELEKYYDAPLFDRIGRRIYPTDRGRLLYGYALHIVSMFDEMEKAVRGGDAPGELRVAANITAGSCLLPELLARFRARNPGVRASATVGNSADAEGAVLDNRADLALAEGEPDAPQLERIPFFRDRLCLIASPDSRIAQRGSVTVEELAREPLLLREPGSAVREILEGLFSQRQLRLIVAWESQSTQAIVRAAAKNLGVSVLPRMMVERELREGLVAEARLEGAELSREFFVVYHKNKHISPPMRAFIDLCLALE
jgi:DNA-binding transcriptional LysR family regulator